VRHAVAPTEGSTPNETSSTVVVTRAARAARGRRAVMVRAFGPTVIGRPRCQSLHVSLNRSHTARGRWSRHTGLAQPYIDVAQPIAAVVKAFHPFTHCFEWVAM
jgi:hypothetical protein